MPKPTIRHEEIRGSTGGLRVLNGGPYSSDEWFALFDELPDPVLAACWVAVLVDGLSSCHGVNAGDVARALALVAARLHGARVPADLEPPKANMPVEERLEMLADQMRRLAQKVRKGPPRPAPPLRLAVGSPDRQVTSPDRQVWPPHLQVTPYPAEAAATPRPDLSLAERPPVPLELRVKEKVQEIEREEIVLALAKNHGHLAKTADTLGICTRTLRIHMRQLGITAPKPPPPPLTPPRPRRPLQRPASRNNRHHESLKESILSLVQGEPRWFPMTAYNRGSVTSAAYTIGKRCGWRIRVEGRPDGVSVTRVGDRDA